MHTRLALVLIIGMIAPLGVAGQTLYRCTEGGVISYVERPTGKTCLPLSSLPPAPKASLTTPATAQTPAANTPPAPLTTAAANPARDEQAAREAKLAQMAKERRIRDLEYELRNAERAHDEELDRLRQRKTWANNNLAGATWEGSISQEMQAATAKHNARIDALRRDLAALRAQP